jgi:hypothetical protein
MKKILLGVSVIVSGILVTVFSIPISVFIIFGVYSGSTLVALTIKAPTNVLSIFKVIPTLGATLIVIGIIYILFFSRE